jgi:UDP-glucose 4-epimerase
MSARRKILVTGGCGNIGGALALELARDPSTYVTVVDNLETSSRHKVPADPDGRIRFIKADVNSLREISEIMLSERFNYVFHYAALVGVQRTLSRPMDVLRDIDGISNVLRLSKNTNVQRVFYSSSSEVYGEPVEFPQNEATTPLNSRLPYAIVKNAGEAFFRSYQREYGLDFTVFRFFNTYGPRQSPDFVVAKFLRAALAGEPITIFGDGSQTRTFCYIDDNIEFTAKCLDQDVGRNEVINVGNDVEIPVRALAEKIIELTGSRSEIVHLPQLVEGDMSRRLPDNSRMRSILNRELTPLEVGLQRLIQLGTHAPIRA